MSKNTKIYAWTYLNQLKDGRPFVRVKIGMTVNDSIKRINAQKTACFSEQIVVNPYNDLKDRDFCWTNLNTIVSDKQVHNALSQYHAKEDNMGTEFFDFPIDQKLSPEEKLTAIFQVINRAIVDIEQGNSFNELTLRPLQEYAVDRIVSAVLEGNKRIDLVACPRQGKTITVLAAVRRLKEVDPNINLVIFPSWVLPVHTSFSKEAVKYKEFSDLVLVYSNEKNCEEICKQHIANGKVVLLMTSIHGKFSDENNWKPRHEWVNKYPDQNKMVVCDEADFGTHTRNQREKLDFLFDPMETLTVYMSGTGVHRFAKFKGKLPHVISISYPQVQKYDPGAIVRNIFKILFDQKIIELLRSIDANFRPSWIKISENPTRYMAMIMALVHGLLGVDTMSPLNSNNLVSVTDGIPISGWLFWVNMTKKQMKAFQAIVQRAAPDWAVEILNGDETNGFKSENYIKNKINQAKAAGKKGIIVISSIMGARSWSISEIQACVFMCDRGDADAVSQKSSRPNTPGYTFHNERKVHSYIIDLAFDPTRFQVTDSIIVNDIVTIQCDSQNTKTFDEIARFIYPSYNIFSVDGFGKIERDDSMLNDARGSSELVLLAKSSEISASTITEESKKLIMKLIKNASGMCGTVSTIKSVFSDVKNFSAPREVNRTKQVNPLENAIRKMRDLILDSVLSVIYLSQNYLATTYQELLSSISLDEKKAEEFEFFFGITPDEMTVLLDNGFVSTLILDTVVYKTQANKVPVNGLYGLSNKSAGIINYADSREMWEMLIGNIPDETFLEPGFKALFPAAGHGTEAEVVRDRMRALNIPESVIDDSLVLIDKFQIHTNELKHKGFNNVITGDYLTHKWENDMKFDLIAANPPYNSPKRNGSHPLYRKFIDKMTDETKATKYSIVVSPPGVFNSSDAAVEGEVFGKLKNRNIKKIDMSMNQYFPGVGSPICSFVWQNIPYQGQTIVDGRSVDISEMNFIPRISDKEAVSVINKLIQTDVVHFRFKKPQTDYYQVAFDELNHISRRLGNIAPVVLKPGETTTKRITKKCDNEQEANNLRDYIASKLISFFNFITRYNNVISVKVIGRIIIPDMSRSWSDQELYGHFNLTQEEIDYVEKTIK